jgi:hypothetical protein
MVTKEPGQNGAHEELAHAELRAASEPLLEPNEGLVEPDDHVIQVNGRPAKLYPAHWLVYLDGDSPREEIVLVDVHADLPADYQGQLFWHAPGGHSPGTPESPPAPAD